MDHAYIEENGLVERYYQGLLPPDEESHFEEHFVTEGLLAGLDSGGVGRHGDVPHAGHCIGRRLDVGAGGLVRRQREAEEHGRC